MITIKQKSGKYQMVFADIGNDLLQGILNTGKPTFWFT